MCADLSKGAERHPRPPWKARSKSGSRPPRAAAGAASQKTSMQNSHPMKNCDRVRHADRQGCSAPATASSTASAWSRVAVGAGPAARSGIYRTQDSDNPEEWAWLCLDVNRRKPLCRRRSAAVHGTVPTCCVMTRFTS